MAIGDLPEACRRRVPRPKVSASQKSLLLTTLAKDFKREDFKPWLKPIGLHFIEKSWIPISWPPMQSWPVPPSKRAVGVFWHGESPPTPLTRVNLNGPSSSSLIPWQKPSQRTRAPAIKRR